MHQLLPVHPRGQLDYPGGRGACDKAIAAGRRVVHEHMLEIRAVLAGTFGER
jgi:hypothetical protein